MRRMGLMLMLFLGSQQVLACPENQHEECALPRPWGGCAQSICVPDFNDPIKDVNDQLQGEADQLAARVHDSGEASDYEDCVPIVTAGVAAAGAKLGASGGPWGAAVGAALGAGGGINMARIACRRAFPE